MKFVTATPSMAPALSALAQRSKAVWGYPEALIDLWAAELCVDAAHILKNLMEVVVAPGGIAGFYSVNVDESDLTHFWVAPEAIGTGIGRQMFQRMADRARQHGLKALTIVSDPHADGFYSKMGAIANGREESQPAGRYLTRFHFTLQPDDSVLAK